MLWLLVFCRVKSQSSQGCTASTGFISAVLPQLSIKNNASLPIALRKHGKAKEFPATLAVPYIMQAGYVEAMNIR
jgi:hypothetical protein